MRETERDGSAVTILSSTIINAYDGIATWRKNLLVPYGKTGRDFIDQIICELMNRITNRKAGMYP